MQTPFLHAFRPLLYKLMNENNTCMIYFEPRIWEQSLLVEHLTQELPSHLEALA